MRYVNTMCFRVLGKMKNRKFSKVHLAWTPYYRLNGYTRKLNHAELPRDKHAGLFLPQPERFPCCVDLAYTKAVSLGPFHGALPCHGLVEDQRLNPRPTRTEGMRNRRTQGGRRRRTGRFPTDQLPFRFEHCTLAKFFRSLCGVERLNGFQVHFDVASMHVGGEDMVMRERGPILIRVPGAGDVSDRRHQHVALERRHVVTFDGFPMGQTFSRFARAGRRRVGFGGDFESPVPKPLVGNSAHRV